VFTYLSFNPAQIETFPMSAFYRALTPNTALQLTGHSAFQSIHGTIWHSARRFEPPGQRAGS
jgi:hypothetical protein